MSNISTTTARTEAPASGLCAQPRLAVDGGLESVALLVDRNGPGAWLRERIMLPPQRQVHPAHRGFFAWAEGPSITEHVGRAFLTGYGTGLRARSLRHAAAALQVLAPQWRGFAMEGLGMAAGVRDGLRLGGHQFADLMVYSGERHSYMLYVGLGWSLARLPRFTWPRLDRLDPLLAPLVLDGYGFHETFFHTEAVLQRRAVAFPARYWPGTRADSQQQVMQGVGRALWFVAGGNPNVLAEMVDRFDAGMHGSLWAGIGLAAAYAGGRDAVTLRQLREGAHEHRCWIAQGAAFAVEARLRAGLDVPHTETAAQELCGRSATEASAITWQARPDPARIDAGDWSAYEQWRQAVAGRLA
ncbi:DUF1702 family protein [Nocardia sp. CNY236]|uniref:DUF1702 family protein n=1 Tax=Nocardia sp. CNY236 TaxID=1169152 RepID=UPI000407C550|nr:DUF1702 family protein [Nocardia sp. CNY236]